MIVEEVKDRAQANARGWGRFALRRMLSLSMRHLLIILVVMEMTRSPVSGLRKLLTAEGGNRLRRCTEVLPLNGGDAPGWGVVGPG